MFFYRKFWLINYINELQVTRRNSVQLLSDLKQPSSRVPLDNTHFMDDTVSLARTMQAVRRPAFNPVVKVKAPSRHRAE